MRCLIIIGVIVAGLYCAPQGKSQSREAQPQGSQRLAELQKPASAEAQREAQRALPELQKLVTDANYRSLGFESASEIKSATLGAPIRVFMVRLDNLREFTPQSNAANLLVDTGEVIYPINVQNQVRSGLTMRNIQGKWQVAGFGKPGLTKALTEIRQTQTANLPAGSFFEVTIPALSLSFVGHLEANQILLTSVTTNQRFQLEAGRTRDAQEVFSLLVPYARDLKTGQFISD